MPDPRDRRSHAQESSAPAEVSLEEVRSFRSQLTLAEDVVDPLTWAGSIPQVQGIAPRVRIGRSRWFNLLWLLPIGFVGLIFAVAAAKGLRNMPSVERFIVRYPGTIETASATANPGVPAWVGIQHFFNLFLMIFIIRSGLQILSDHPRLYWTRHSTPGKDWFRVQKPVPSDPLWTAKQDSISLPRQVGLPGLRHSIGLARWWAQVVESDAGHVAALHDAVEQLADRFGVEEPSAAVAEHPVVGPVWETVKSQPTAPPVELGDRRGVQVDAAAAGAGLHVELDGSAGEALHGPAHRHPAGGAVEVGPLEPNDLAAAHPSVGSEVQCRVEALATSCREEGGQLIGAPGAGRRGS